MKKIIKLIASIPLVRPAHKMFKRTLFSVASINRVASTLYHQISFFTYNREQYAVLKGAKAYFNNIKKSRPSRVELRRNIHRIEKGLLMRPRRKVFAKDYIYETVVSYKAVAQDIAKGIVVDESEAQWAHDVLDEYFNVIQVDGDKQVRKAHDVFEGMQRKSKVKTQNNKPYNYKEIKKSEIGYEEFLKLSLQRRSVRWFKKKKVPRELVDKAVIVGRQAPTACNRIPYEFRIYDDPELVRKIAGIPFGTAGYAHNIPMIIVLVGRLDSYFEASDRHAIYIDASLAAMSFMFALETLGLNSLAIHWPAYEFMERKMQKLLGLKVYERPIFLMGVGYAEPEGMIAFSQKKPLDILRSYNKIDN
ncbi:MAG: nitroreductase family protein [Candidatus Saccharibacteria bacterium]|nr:nitroreductase family protein [Candidatus Saccharibacteria bacterium]